MPVRPPPRNGSCSTPGLRTRLVRSTRARRSWTGWSRSRSAASRSRPPRRPASGATTASTSSTRPATSTSPPRSSARCACSTAPWRCSTPCRASSRSPRRSGGRPTSTASRASASSTRWTASAPTSARTSSRSSAKLQANPVAIQLPIGSEEHFAGVIDLIGMRAIRYKDETLGAEYIVEDIPADLLDEAKHYREILVEKATEADDALLEKYVAGEAISEDELRGAIRKRAIRSVRHEKRPFVPVICGSAFKNKGVQPLLDAVVDYLPSPLDIPPVIGLDPRKAEETPGRAPGVRPGAVLRARVQDHDRPVRRSARLHPRLLGRDGVGLDGLQRDQGQDRARRPSPQDAREQARGDQGSLRGRHRRRRRPPQRDDGRHDLRREEAGRARVDGLPRAGHHAGHRAAHQGRPGEARARASASCRPRTRPSACRPTSTPARSSSAAWASCTSRSSSTA